MVGTAISLIGLFSQLSQWWLPFLELVYFGGLKGDKWVSAGYLLPSPLPHNTHPSTFYCSMRQVLNSATLLAGECPLLPLLAFPPCASFKSSIFTPAHFQLLLPIKGFRLHKQCFHSSGAVLLSAVDVNKADYHYQQITFMFTATQNAVGLKDISVSKVAG